MDSCSQKTKRWVKICQFLKKSYTFWRKWKFPIKSFLWLQGMQFWPLATLTKNFFAKNQNNSCPVFGIKQTITFSSQKNEVVRKKQSGFLEYHFDEGSESFFIRSPKSMYSTLGISFEKTLKKLKTSPGRFQCDFDNPDKRIQSKKRFLFNIRNYWNNHFFSQKYLNFTVKIFWTRIMPFWQAWIDFLPKNTEKVWFVLRKQTME